jgi:putative ABC transport system ATP-binding protein
MSGSVLVMGHQAGEALVPVVIGVIIDQVLGTGQLSDLVLWLAVLACLFAMFSYSHRFGARLLERAIQQSAHDLRVDLTRRALDPRGSGTNHLPGALLSIATSDTLWVGLIHRSLAGAAAASTALLVGAVALFRISIPLGAFVVLGAPVMLIVMHLLGKSLERRSSVEQAEAARAAGLATDLVSGLRVLKGIGAEASAADRYRRASRGSLKATLRAANAEAAYEGVTLLLTGAFLALVALVSGRLALAGQISVGDFVSSVGLAQFLLGPMYRISSLGANVARSRASAERVAEVLGAPSVVEDGFGRMPPAVTGEIRFRNVTYGGLRDVSFDVMPGEVVGLALTEPADAVSLLKCLSRAVDPASGSIEIDGIPLKTLDPNAVHAAILIAAHDADLFEGTLRDNVAAAVADTAQVEAALVAAAADQVAATLPDGVDSHLTERGRSLSGGQRQRVALARALAADPPVLVVHDPTTAVDAVTESRIAKGIRRMRSGRTTLLITTSPVLLAVCDRVIFLDRGMVVAGGSHEDLADYHAQYRTAVLA